MSTLFTHTSSTLLKRQLFRTSSAQSQSVQRLLNSAPIRPFVTTLPTMANDGKPTYTLAEGVPVPRDDTTNQIPTGSGGGHVLLTSTQLIENLAHFSRERIPERSVHAKAAGARGYFEVTDDISDLTSAAFLNGIGKKSEVLCRVSTVGPEKGSADTVRDFRGFSVKVKTEEGNHDWVFNNQPVFFVRDPVKFPSMNRSHKKHPKTNAPSPDTFFDFHTSNQEGIHALMFLFGDRGIPKSVRHVNAYSGNTYTFTNTDGSYRYVRFTFKTNQGIDYFTEEEAAKIAGANPDYHILDLQEAIDKGDFPSWNVFVQILDPQDIPSVPFNVFDMTKVWPYGKFPLRKVGRMVLDKNPENWFAEIEQAAFSPSTMVPGIDASPDPMLQARMFAYPDAARYRLGANYQTLPTNAPKAPVYTPTERDGFMNFTKNYGGDPNYNGSQLKPKDFTNSANTKTVRVQDNGGASKEAAPQATAKTADYTRPTLPVAIATEVTDKDFEQPRALWKIYGTEEGAQERFITNATGMLSGVKEKFIRDKAYAMFGRVDSGLGKALEKSVEGKINGSG